VTDGRSANVEFLKKNFGRNWKYNYDDSLDQHVFNLDEPAWGNIASYYLSLKRESP